MFAVGAVWVIIVAASRMIVGAYYLDDVGAEAMLPAAAAPQ